MSNAVGRVTRRTFMSLAAAVTGATLTGCPRQNTNGVKVFRRSGKGRHVSNAAKKHNANRLYRTFAAALNDPAHPGDNSKVVEITINRERFNTLFGSGNNVADLRNFLL